MKSIRDYKFEIEFGLTADIITLKVCDHFQLQAYVKSSSFDDRAECLINCEGKCPVCGKGVE